MRKLTRADLSATFENAPPAHRVLLSQCTFGSESGTESIVRQRLQALRIDVRQQVKVPGVGRVDFGIVGTRIVIEVDGRQYHQDPEKFEADRRRDAELVALNFTVIRLSYLQVTTDWPWCVRMILGAMTHA